MTLRAIASKIASFAAVALCAGSLSLATAGSADAQARHGFSRGGGGFAAGRSVAAPRSFAGARRFAAPRAFAGRPAFSGPARVGGHPWRHRHRRWGGGYYWGAPLVGLGLGTAYYDYDPYPYYGYPVYSGYRHCVKRKRWVARNHRWVKRWVRVCR
jgi:hypothetical protein